jgi:hypothetical protein
LYKFKWRLKVDINTNAPKHNCGNAKYDSIKWFQRSQIDTLLRVIAGIITALLEIFFKAIIAIPLTFIVIGKFHEIRDIDAFVLIFIFLALIIWEVVSKFAGVIFYPENTIKPRPEGRGGCQ